MEQKRFFKKTGPLLLKIAVTTAALVFVYRKIDMTAFLETMLASDPVYFLLAIAAFNVSKIISAFRLNVFYRIAGVFLSDHLNLRFYYLGMFYNMFLPGSVGGDAFKVYLLKQSQQQASVKKLIAASLLDRMSGLVLLTVMAGVFLGLSSFDPAIALYKWGIIAAVPLIIPLYYLFNKLVFPAFISVFKQTGIFSFFVQAGQVCCALALLRAAHVDTFYWDYLTLFMISSVFAIIPLTIGGAGARELVFIFGATYLHVEQSSAVVFTLMFFCVSAVSSLAGLCFVPGMDKKLVTGNSHE